MIFIVAALLYYQSSGHEGFTSYAKVPHFQNSWASWSPTMPPIAGRLYDPKSHMVSDPYPVPADLAKAPVSQPFGTVPPSQQRPAMTPGPGVTMAPRDAMAQIKDLMELDNKITLWLDAASQRERDTPGSLTPTQLQRRVILQGRLQDVRDQLGTGMITDSWKRVADELKELRNENAGWQERSPSLEEVYSFGRGADPSLFLSHGDYVKFYGIFSAGVLEMQGLTQPDPLQKVRLQQLQVMRQDLMDVSKRIGTPPIKMATAQLYLRQMLKVDQPLPSLYSIEPPPQEKCHESSVADVLADLRDLEWKLTVKYDPASQEVKRATAAMLDRLARGDVTPQEARTHVLALKMRAAPAPYSSVFGAMGAPLSMGAPLKMNGAMMFERPNEIRNSGAMLLETMDMTGPKHVRAHPTQKSEYNPKDLVSRATTLCKQIGEAFPRDAEALGCQKHIRDEMEAETVINTVCDRLRFSVPSVTPEQFGCPRRNV